MICFTLPCFLKGDGGILCKAHSKTIDVQGITGIYVKTFGCKAYVKAGPYSVNTDLTHGLIMQLC